MRNARTQNIKCLFGVHEYTIRDAFSGNCFKKCKHCKNERDIFLMVKDMKHGVSMINSAI